MFGRKRLARLKQAIDLVRREMARDSAVGALSEQLLVKKLSWHD